jgi:hypothetical protein
MNRTNDLQALSALAIDLPGGGFVRVRKATPAFQMWRGPKPADTFGGKAVLDYCGNPLFAEEYTLRMLQADGWSGVWVNSYRREYLASYEPREQVALPAIDKKRCRESLVTTHSRAVVGTCLLGVTIGYCLLNASARAKMQCVQVNGVGSRKPSQPASRSRPSSSSNGLCSNDPARLDARFKA